MALGNRYRKAAIKARELTNKQLATELASIGPVDRDRFNDLLPQKRDKEAFIELMKVVEDEAEMDRQLAYLRDNLATAGKVALRVLRFFA